MRKNSWAAYSKRQGDLRFDVILIILLAALTILFFYPMYLVAICAFSSPTEIYNGRVLFWVRGDNVKGFEQVIATASLWRGYLNSAFYTVLGTLINLFFTITGAFVLSRKHFAPRKYITWMIVFTMFFGGGMIPGYLLVKNLHLLNTVWALVLPGALSTWNLMVTRTFLTMSVPDELQEAAMIDGCNNVQFLLHVVLPLSSTIIAVMGLFYGVGHWNSYWNALLYISDVNKYPLQLVLRNLLLDAKYALEAAAAGQTDYDQEQIKEMYELAESMKYIIVLASVLPIVVFFPFVEKYFVKGVMIGSLKG